MSKNDNFKLDFIGIGSGKAASSWIFTCLKEHPEICGSRPKEIHFFDKNYKKGLSWYKKHFGNCDESKIKGEFTPAYLTYKRAPALIKRHFPEAKLIACLRSPLDSIISKYYFDYSRGKTNQTLEEYIEVVNPEVFLFYKGLSRFFNFFSKDQILVLIYDDIKKNPIAFIQRIYKFLGVDSSFIPASATQSKNKTFSAKTKFRFLNRFLWQTRSMLKKLPGGLILVKTLKELGANYIVKKIFKWNRKKTNLKPLEKKYPSDNTIKKIKNYYQSDIRKLEELINQDLSHWK